MAGPHSDPHASQEALPEAGVYWQKPQDHGLDKALDNDLLRLAAPALERAEKVKFELPIVNTNRTVGTILMIMWPNAMDWLCCPTDTIQIKFKGSASQSFGAFLARGVTMELEGDANDYVGKGLSGGKIVIYPPRESSFEPQHNIIVGNVVLYGSTSGEAYFRGRAAERFCVRNSGAWAVVEGVGDHGCEYMTGGRVVILGNTGRNFAAGMSGGIAYVLAEHDKFRDNKCNLGTVELDPVETDDDLAELMEMLEKHHRLTGSNVADRLLSAWPQSAAEFVKVMPTDYKRVLLERQTQEIS